MDNLLHALENLVDGLGNPAYEVEYHVGYFHFLASSIPHLLHLSRVVY
jgi:hypothetical protein